MKRAQGHRCRYEFAVGLVAIVGLEAVAVRATGKPEANNENGQPPRVVVQVYNYGHVSTDILAQAELEAAEIYQAVGVEIVWTNCKLPQDSQCAEYLDPAHLGLRLLPEIAPSLGGSDRTMGLAVGNLASVSLHRVHEEAAAFEVSVHAVLAPTLAHEIGHLLLASQGHSPSGIMRAHWCREDYERAPRGAFNFMPEQARSIRDEIRKRAQVQVTTARSVHQGPALRFTQTAE